MGAHRLTPRMAELLHRIRRADRPPLHSLTVGEARLAYAAASEVLESPRTPLARVEEFVAPSADGAGLPARVYAPSRERLPVLLYLHSGGFTIGSLETHDSLARQFARRSGAAVVAIEYRLAPEHRFPTAADDAWAVLQWLAREGAAALGLDGARLAVAGDSAGATLATVCAIQARDAGLPLAAQLLITPGTAPEPIHPSHRTFGEGFLLEAQSIEWFFTHYIDADARNDWRFAPLLAESLDGVAPACVILAECDPLVDEGLAYADRLHLAGVPVELEIFRGVTHDFIKMGRALDEADVAQARAARFVNDALGTDETG